MQTWWGLYYSSMCADYRPVMWLLMPSTSGEWVRGSVLKAMNQSLTELSGCLGQGLFHNNAINLEKTHLVPITHKRRRSVDRPSRCTAVYLYWRIFLVCQFVRTKLHYLKKPPTQKKSWTALLGSMMASRLRVPNSNPKFDHFYCKFLTNWKKFIVNNL